MTHDDVRERGEKTPAADDILRLGIGVAAIEHMVLVVVRGGDAQDAAATLRVPVTPGTARALASQLLAAAAVVDLVGHEQILQDIAQMVGEHAAALAALPPGGVH